MSELALFTIEKELSTLILANRYISSSRSVNNEDRLNKYLNILR